MTTKVRRDKIDELFPDFELIAKRLRIAAIITGVFAALVWIVFSVQGK